MPYINICVTVATTSLYTSTKLKFPEALSLLFPAGWYRRTAAHLEPSDPCVEGWISSGVDALRKTLPS